MPRNLESTLPISTRFSLFAARLGRRKEQLSHWKEIKQARRGMKHAMDTAVTFWTDIYQYGPTLLTGDTSAIPERMPGYREILQTCFSDFGLRKRLPELPQKSLKAFSKELRAGLEDVNKRIFRFTREGNVNFAIMSNQGSVHHEALNRAILKAGITNPSFRTPYALRTHLVPNKVDITPFYLIPNQPQQTFYLKF